MPTTTLSATQQGIPARWLIRYLNDQGVETREICDTTGIDEASLISESGIMHTPIYLEVFNWAAMRLRNNLVGADVAEAVDTGEYGILGHLVMNGPSLRESFQFIEKYHSIFSPDFSFRFSYDARNALCRYTEADLPGADSTQDINYGLSLIVKAIRERAGDTWHPIRTCFTYSQPDDLSRHRAYFGSTLHFDQPQNLIEFEQEVVDLASEKADINLLPILLNQANKLLDEQQIQTDIVKQVRLQITTSIGYQAVTSETTAQHLNVSVRQLQRLLQARQTSFRQIKDETIVKIARDALTNSDMSITDIAMKLAYSETSAFDRMFKKKVGISPLQYRKKHLP